MTKLTQEMLAEIPVWALDQMALPRSRFSPEERAAAQNELKRRYGFPAGAVKVPPKEDPLPDASTLVPLVGGGWAWSKEE
jgi:hypothetical protein